jgi:uncharacterized protein (UPF0276 family)
MSTVAPSLAARPGGESQSRPAFGTTYGGRDPVFLERVLPLVDYLEVTPDTIAESHQGTLRVHSATLAELRALGAQTPILLHGVGLSIGTYDGWSTSYLHLLDTLVEQLPVAWHSEHLAYTMVEGAALGTMLPLPRTAEALDMVTARVLAIQERYGLPFLLEHVVNLLPEWQGDYSQAAFLNALTERTGCGLILDAYNLECDAHNFAFDIAAFLDELHLDSVREIHLANGVEHRGFRLDVHSRLTRDSTIALAEHVVSRAAGAVQVVLYELLREAVPILGHDTIFQELQRLRPHFKGCDHGPGNPAATTA